MNKLRGFTLIELLIVVAIIAILAAIAVPNFLEAQTRSKVSRVKSDHRSLATAIETYYIDNNTYPAATTDGADTMDADFYNGAPGNVGSTFRRRDTATAPILSITTPIAYITSNFPDPFADTRGIGFRYLNAAQSQTNPGTGWMLGSYGPNTDENSTDPDIDWENGIDPKGTKGAGDAETLYNPAIAQPSALLLTAYYDPSNGTISPGEVLRVKQ